MHVKRFKREFCIIYTTDIYQMSRK